MIRMNYTLNDLIKIVYIYDKIKLNIRINYILNDLKIFKLILELKILYI